MSEPVAVVNEEEKNSSNDDIESKSTSTYDTAINGESDEVAAPAEVEVVVESAPEDSASVEKSEEVANETAIHASGEEIKNGHHDSSDTNHDEDKDGRLSDDERSNSSSVGGSSADSPVPDTERQEGDGEEEEEKKDKKLDHDEDRRDPQYIPKRGVFYEHDDRTMDDDSEVKKEPVREPRKSKAFEAVERWGHDMYNEDEQSPKTTEELIDIYGYDIRKEEAPPKARRRRRYGKGPNKYQRSWEDEQAYNKTPTRGGFKGQKRSPRNFVQRDEDFPALDSRNKEGGVPAGPQSGDTTPPPQRRVTPRPSVKFIPKPPKEDNLPTRDEIRAVFAKIESEASDRSEAYKNFNCYGSVKPFNDKEPTSLKGSNDSGTKNEAGRGRSSMPRRGRINHDQIPPFSAGSKNHPGPHHHGSRSTEKHGKGPSTADEDIATLAQHFSNAVINVDKNIAPIRSTSEPPAEERPTREVRREKDDGGKHHSQSGKHGSDKHHANERQQGGQPLEQPSTKPKRYSTQRQRPTQQMAAAAQPPTTAPPAPPAPAPPAYLPPQQGYYPPPQHGLCPPEGAPHMTAPPPAQFQPAGNIQMVTFLPSVPPPPTNTFHPPPNVYVPPAPYIPPPPIVQPPPAEVYQGGVTYYNTHSQVVPRSVPSRRVKLAIPIVSPDNSQPIQ